MFKTEKQQCQAIRLLLKSLRLDYLWTETGPTQKACKYLEGSPLSSGEQILLRCAFDLWNGAGHVELYKDILGVLDSQRTTLLLNLVMQVNRGGDCVQEWIERQEERYAYHPPDKNAIAREFFETGYDKLSGASKQIVDRRFEQLMGKDE